ncbi:protease modulator HflC [Beijerinckia indica]|uniref:Protein HflC n=1 Tax=Beijerinckia indica subsp. indica (strain ATCC 9039 / DSM 1715 / NCIMB 8712) TaxID=395963 RepID=B2ICT7_BEII9|nr:protease modulator HflC [Beijerinckia indica]ACB95361.1 HflC protein [Beijerinckia indica subsp. indica ATCC 9039]
MKYPSGLALSLVLLVLVLLGGGTFFIVQQTQQALVLRFGEPLPGRGLVTKPGLYFKLPSIETAVFLDNRILDVETAKQEVLASDNTRIEVDAFLRYRIIDPLRFYQSVGSVERAANQLGYILNSAVRRVLGEANLTQIVRDERAQLMVKIRDQVNREADRLGVTVVDVRIRRADLPRQISEKVFNRMQTERAREAAEYRAQGSEQAQMITAKANRDVTIIQAEARRQGEQIRGEGDAQRARIFAEAFGRDQDFFAFYRSMQAYETSLKPDSTKLVIDPGSEFFRFLGSSSGRAAQ